MERIKSRLVIVLLALFAIFLHFTFFNWSGAVIGQHFANFFCDDITDTNCLRISYGEQAHQSMFLTSLVGIVVPVALLCLCVYLVVVELLAERPRSK